MPSPTSVIYDDEVALPPGSKRREELLRSGRIRLRNPPPGRFVRALDILGDGLVNTPPLTLLMRAVALLFFGSVAVSLVRMALGV